VAAVARHQADAGRTTVVPGSSLPTWMGGR
jgi:hypothetical protein